MDAILHKANTRGHRANDWLESWHTFSFGQYHDPTRMHFGALRALNDNTVVPGGSFGTHGHHNMEVVTLPLQGTLQHHDSLGHNATLQPGDVQVLSAGTGATHSEINGEQHQFLKFLQLWIVPHTQQLQPRVDRQTFDPAQMQNQLQTVVSPMGEKEGVPINQQAWVSRCALDKSAKVHYRLHNPANGIYLMVLEGDVMAGEFALNRRDGLGLVNREELYIGADTDAQLLMIEVPMISVD